MTCFVKPFFTLIIVFLSTILSFATVPANDVKADSTFADPAFSEAQDIQLYLYHLNALLEYQEHEIVKQKFIIVVLSGIIALIVILLFLKWLSRRFERGYKLFRAKKHELAAAATLKGVFHYWKIKDSIKSVQSKLKENEGDVINLEKVVDTASKYGLEPHVLKGNIKNMLECLIYPIVVVFPNHISVVYKCKKDKIFVADPFYGYLHLNPYYFANNWFIDNQQETGVFIAFIPGKERSRKIEKFRLKLTGLDKLEKKNMKQFILH